MSDTPKPNNQTEELSHLGPYEIESRLGQGGMGIVYCATDKNLGRKIAIKVLHPHLLRHENLKQRFRREARMHAKLMHPNIVTLLSLFEDDEHMALVMELVIGDDLKEYLRKNPSASLKEKLSISVDVLSGLDASHQFGMVHRDLKPANVLVSNQGEVKLVDFGLAKPEEGEDDLTQSGATVGSFRYMAPEQILNKPVDARTDLYAFGILLFYMTVGKLPFDATSNGGEFEIMEKQVREPAPSPQKLNPKIPTALSDLILKLLDKQKHNRPENALAVRDEIQAILETLDETPKPKRKPAEKVVITLNNPSNSEVAKQWLKHGYENMRKTKAITFPLFIKFFSGLTGIAFLFMMLGFVIISILNMAEDTAMQNANKTQVATPIAQKVLPVASQKLAPIKKEIPIETKKVQTSKPKATIAPKKEVVKKEPPKNILPVTKAPVEKSVASVVTETKHKITRSDKSFASRKSAHEFLGGNHLFYPELAKKTWLSSYKTGETMIEFEQPITVSNIVINKASVGRSSFKRGFVSLEIQRADSKKWIRLFERKGDDVDIKVNIKHVQKRAPLILAVRLRFKTADPITVGPIDLLP